MSHNMVLINLPTIQPSMNQLMSECGMNKCCFYVVDSVNSHVTYGVHVAVIGRLPSGNGVVMPLSMQMYSMS